MNLNNNEQELPEVQLEECALKLDAKDFACRSKALKRNHREENLPAFPQEPYLLGKELEPMLNQGNILSSDYEVSKKVVYLLRHSQQMHREEDGAVLFWRIT